MSRCKDGFLISDPIEIDPVPYRERDCHNDLMRYLEATATGGKVCALFGLRQSGKTILMHQAIRDLPEDMKKKAVYILCPDEQEATVYMNDLITLLEDLTANGKRIFFIDEITNLMDFPERARVLADHYASKQDGKVVITGGDTIGLSIAEEDELHGRMVTIHMTRVPFGEFCRLTGEGTFKAYLRYGGTLNAEPYRDDQSLAAYIERAIVKNITSSVMKCVGTDLARLSFVNDLITSGQMVEIIRKWVNRREQGLIEEILGSAPTDSTWADSVIDCSGVIGNAPATGSSCVDNVTDCSGIIGTGEVNGLSGTQYKYIRYALLEPLDIYVPFRTEVITGLPEDNTFEKREIETQLLIQIGFTKTQIQTAIRSLAQNEALPVGSDTESASAYQTRATRLAEGKLLKELVLADTDLFVRQPDPERYRVETIRVSHLPDEPKAPQNAEIDMFIEDMAERETTLIEVSYANTPSPTAANDLADENVLTAIEKFHEPVTRKCVIYMGPSKKVNAINYINAESYLRQLYDMSRNRKLDLARLLTADQADQTAPTNDGNERQI